jgi:hypothetical protein
MEVGISCFNVLLVAVAMAANDCLLNKDEND